MMKMELKSLRLQMFKGTQDSTYNFQHSTKIVGDMGIGKTTIATAWYWLICDKDYELNSNPNVAPIGVEECIPTVTATLEVDGREIIIAKKQSIKRIKREGEKEKTSINNSYEINSVPKTERDFKEQLEQMGINYKIMLYICHPEALLNKKKAEIREILFGMASKLTDLDIANKYDDMKEVREKLSKGYKAEEIEAMNKATIKKCIEAHGKDGILTKARIEELEKAKVQVNVVEQNRIKSQIEGRISELDSLISSTAGAISELKGREMHLQFEKSAIIQKYEDDMRRKQREILIAVSTIQDRMAENQRILEKEKKKQAENKEKLNQLEKSKSQIREEFERNKSSEFDDTPFQFDTSKWIFDESSTICSLCGQTLPGEKIAELRDSFEQKKAKAQDDCEERLLNARNRFTENRKQKHSEIIKQANVVVERVKYFEDSNRESEKKVEEVIEEINKLQDRLKSCEKEDNPSNEEYLNFPEYINLDAEHKEVLEKIKEAEKAENPAEIYVSEKNDLLEKLENANKMLFLVQSNERLDKKIQDLREKGIAYQKSIDEAENILFQLKLLKERMEDTLTSEINSHFDKVKWILFSTQKNGERVSDCQLEIDGYKYKEATNVGREFLVRLDICYSLQRFYDSYYPVFLDGAESVASYAIPRNKNTQLITLALNENVKKLEIEVSE